jgi:hypothetical protein
MQFVLEATSLEYSIPKHSQGILGVKKMGGLQVSNKV